MEDSESEWAIQEHQSSKEGEGVDETSMLKWVLNKGYGIGKKMVITSIIVSSAPLVLPPLVVFSAMGVAFSVPFGFVFAGYACTNKLMSKLLPNPEIETPLMLDDEKENEEQLEDIKQGFECLEDTGQIEGGLVTNTDGIVDEKDYYFDEDDDLTRENLMQREDEEERIGYVEERTEIRFELVNDDGYGKKVEALMTNIDENVVQDDQEYERIKDIEHAIELEDYGGYHKKVEALMTNVDENVVQDDQEYERIKDIEHGVELDDGYKLFLQGKNIVIEQEVEMRVGLNVAGDERIQGSGSNVNVGGGNVDEKGYEEDVGEYLEGDDDDDSLEEERKETMEDETEEIVKGSTGLLEKIRDEERRNTKNDSTVPLEEERKETMEDETEEIVKGSTGLLEKIRDEGRRNMENESTMEPKNENMGLQEKNSSNLENEDAIMRMKKQQLIHANEDAREIADESGLDLFDERNTSMDLESLEALEKTNESAVNDNVDVMALPSFKRPPLDSNNVRVASTKDTKVPSREDNLDEEKVWEKIGAMRAIVGYNAPREATYIGELKALYVFTGVEPPTSFKGTSKLDEVNANLKFLMSIVGVK